MAKKQNEINWSSLEPPLRDELQEISTHELLYHIEKESSGDTSNREETALKISDIVKKHNKDCVRVPIQRSIYNKILKIKKENCSRLSVPQLIEIILNEVLKQENKGI